MKTIDHEIESLLRQRAERHVDELERMYVVRFIDRATDPDSAYPFPSYFIDCTPFLNQARRVAAIQAAADRFVQTVYGQLADYVSIDDETKPRVITVMLLDDQREITITLDELIRSQP
jgi:hypothetical protein